MRFTDFDFFESVEAIQSPPPRAATSGGSAGRVGSTPAKPAATKPAPKPAPAKPIAQTKPTPTPAKPAPATDSTAKKSGFGFDQFVSLAKKGMEIGTTAAGVAGQIKQWTSPGGSAQAAVAPPPPATEPGPPPPFPFTGTEPAGMPAPDPSAPTSTTAAGATAAAPPQPTPTPGPAPTPPPAHTIGGDQIGALIQALQQRQIPPLPGTAVSAPTTTAVAPADGLSLLRVLLTNPQLAQALWAPQAFAMPRSIGLPMPAMPSPHRPRSTQIPLGAVMNAIAALAGQAMTELNEATAEDAEEVPSYLVGEDGEFLVDPANANDRAALVTHLVRMSNAAQRPRARGPVRRRRPVTQDRVVLDLDDSDAFARDAGFGM